MDNGFSIFRDSDDKIIIRLEPYIARRLRQILYIVSTSNILDIELFCLNEKFLKDLFNTNLKG